VFQLEYCTQISCERLAGIIFVHSDTCKNENWYIIRKITYWSGQERSGTVSGALIRDPIGTQASAPKPRREKFTWEALEVESHDHLSHARDLQRDSINKL
jgi:hypothetical protein